MPRARPGRSPASRVLDVVAEPVAAALGHGALDAAAGGDRTVLVRDLGGGTFDTTVTLRGMDLKVLCTDGTKELGGSDFDDRIVMHLVEAFRAQFPDADDPLTDQHSETRLRRTPRRRRRHSPSASTTPSASCTRDWSPRSS
ncbi:Hsp70 family protein [Streptomyces sp. NPDC052042]|uniref:Hsp70 family protein n=1 Tax=Streptomyces sp. NPDC052042 TaxID=3365683 RepID=UPI0037D7F495